MTAIVLLLALQGADWQDRACAERRPLAVRNPTRGALAEGRVIAARIERSLLRPGTAARADFADLVLVHGTRVVPCHVDAEPESPRIVLRFRLAAAIEAGAEDPHYRIYYARGGEAAPGRVRGKDVADAAEDFEDGRAGVEVEAGLTAVVKDGALAVTGAGPGCTSDTPGRIVLLGRPPEGAFTFSVDLTIDAGSAAAGVRFDLAEGEEPAADLTRLRKLVQALESSELDARDSAATTLAGEGPGAIPLLEASIRTGSAEAAARAREVLARIRERHPPRRILAGAGPAAEEVPADRWTVIGGDVRRYPSSLPPPVRLRILIVRDDEGAVSVTWNGLRRDRGDLSGTVTAVSVDVWRTGEGEFGRVTIDNLRLLRAVEPVVPATVGEVEARP